MLDLILLRAVFKLHVFPVVICSLQVCWYLVPLSLHCKYPCTWSSMQFKVLTYSLRLHVHFRFACQDKNGTTYCLSNIVKIQWRSTKYPSLGAQNCNNPVIAEATYDPSKAGVILEVISWYLLCILSSEVYWSCQVLPSLSLSLLLSLQALSTLRVACLPGLLNPSCHSKPKKNAKSKRWSSAIVIASSFVDAAAVFSLACQIRLAGFGQP